MVFSSTIFLFIFLPLVYILYLIAPKKARNYLLLIFSLVFYAWGEPIFVLIMLVSMVFNYSFALLIGHSKSAKAKKGWVVGAAVFNVALLVAFKYTGFIVADIFNAAFGLNIPVPQIPLPIGISFFTFQILSYVVDVYRGIIPAQKKFSNVALSLAFFPQLIAGPIIKYHDIADQLDNRHLSAPEVAMGIRRFILGLSKKLLIANVLGAVADKIFAVTPGDLSAPVAWLGAIAYTLQIYFDFSGYSDMAIGLGHMFGFKIMENFNYPFVSASINGFWKRWHISLTTWFREYVYIPLGGNRKGLARTCLNMTIVFFLTGLWHGAAWTFLVWGLMHGFFMILERLGVIRTEKNRKFRWLGVIYTLLIVIVTFTIFRSDTIGQGFSFIGAMFAGWQLDAAHLSVLGQAVTPAALAMLVIAIPASLPIIPRIKLAVSGNAALAKGLNIAGYIAAFILFAICVLAVSSGTYNPFIYYRF